VYITNRDAANRLTISSPLEANKSNTLLFHVAAIDNGFGNPTFACLELDHTEADEDPTGEALEEVRQVWMPCAAMATQWFERALFGSVDGGMERTTQRCIDGGMCAGAPGVPRAKLM
jgi:hypothetical protein